MEGPSYYRASGRAYLVFSCPQETDLRGFQYRMLTANPIEGLIRCSLREIDGENHLYFDITGCQSIRTLFETRPIPGETWRQLLQNLIRLARTLENYLLDADRLVLSADLVFLNITEGRFCFLYLPEGDFSQDLFRFAAEHIDKTAKEETASVYRLCSLAEESAEVFWPLLREELQEDPAAEEKEEDAGFAAETVQPENAGDIKEKSPLTENPAGKRKRRWTWILKWALLPVFAAAAAALLALQYYYYLSETARNLCCVGAALLAAAAAFVAADQILTIKERRREDSGEELPLSVENTTDHRTEWEDWDREAAETGPAPEPATVFLKASDAGRLYGSGRARGCTIALEDLPLTVGKAEEYVDQVLGDPSVSRVHARFARSASGDIEITDLGSTNGTKVNGIAVGMQEKRKIERGDEIQIGALTFYYR